MKPDATRRPRGAAVRHALLPFALLAMMAAPATGQAPPRPADARETALEIGRDLGILLAARLYCFIPTPTLPPRPDERGLDALIARHRAALRERLPDEPTRSFAEGVAAGHAARLGTPEPNCIDLRRSVAPLALRAIAPP